MAQEGIFRRTWRWGKRAMRALTANKYTTIAGALAFFLIMSFVPFLFWLILLFGRAGIHPETILELELFGWAKDLLLVLLENAEGTASTAGIVLLVTTLWSSSAFFYHLRRSGEILYAYRRQKKGWKVRLSAILLTLAVFLFCLVAGALVFAVSIFARKLFQWLYYLCLYSTILVIGFCAAWILNSYVCPYRCKPQDIFLGSLLTALSWLAASGAFSLYVAFGNKERLYGALTLAIVFLLWIYWMMICFTAGAVYNRHHMQIKGLEHKTL